MCFFFCLEVAQEGSSNDEEYLPSKVPHLENDQSAVIGEGFCTIVRELYLD